MLFHKYVSTLSDGWLFRAFVVGTSLNFVHSFILLQQQSATIVKICIEQCIVFNRGAGSLPLTSSLYLFSCVSLSIFLKSVFNCIELLALFCLSLQLFYTLWEEIFIFENKLWCVIFITFFFLSYSIKFCSLHSVNGKKMSQKQMHFFTEKFKNHSAWNSNWSGWWYH